MLKWRRKKWLTRIRIDKKNFKKKKHNKKSHKIRVLKRIQKDEVVVPNNFSLLDNTENTLKCLNHLIDYVHKRKLAIKVDSSKVDAVDPAALMYLISILKDANHKNVIIRGNYPRNKDTRRLFIKYGFSKFVTNQKVIKSVQLSDEDTLQIEEGKDISTETAKSVLDFAERHQCFKYDKDNLSKKLYASLIEMMGNVRQHAYTCASGHWLVVCEFKKGFLEFVLFDKGVGIPTTVQKKFIKDTINYFTKKRESYILKSTLEGSFRTQTKENNRGKGLPQIFEFLRSNRIENARLISGFGYCEIYHDGVRINVDLKNKLHGTLFSWKIKGEDIGETD